MNKKWLVLLMLVFFVFSTQTGFAALSEVSCKTITSPTTLYFKPGGYTTFQAGQVCFRGNSKYVHSGALSNATTLYFKPGGYTTFMGGKQVVFGADGHVDAGVLQNPTTLYFKPGGYTTFMAGRGVQFGPDGFVIQGTLCELPRLQPTPTCRNTPHASSS